MMENHAGERGREYHFLARVGALRSKKDLLGAIGSYHTL